MLKKAFKSKKVKTLKESAANRMASKNKTTTVRVGSDKAIMSDPASIKEIQKYINKRVEKGKDVTVEEILAKVKGLGNINVVDVVVEKRNLDQVFISQPDILRLDDNTAIQGNPALIKRAYDYVKENPDSAKDPESIIKYVDEPILVTFTKDEDGEETKESELMAQLHVINVSISNENMVAATEQEQHLRNMTLRQKYRALGMLLEVGTLKPDALEKIEQERLQISEMVNIEYPYQTMKVGFEDFTVRRPSLDTKINPFSNTIVLTKGTKGGSRLKPLGKGLKTMKIQTKDYTLEDDVTKKLRDFMTSEMIDNFNKLFDGELLFIDRVEQNETSVQEGYYPGREVSLKDGRGGVVVRDVNAEVVVLEIDGDTNYVSKSLIIPFDDGDYEIEIMEPEEIVEPENIAKIDVITRQQFFKNKILQLARKGEITEEEDVAGMKAYSDFKIAKETYLREVAPSPSSSVSEKEGSVLDRIVESLDKPVGLEEKGKGKSEADALLTYMAAMIEWQFKRMYPYAFAVLPFDNFTGLYESMRKGPSWRRDATYGLVPVLSGFEVDFRKHIEKNMSRIFEDTNLKMLSDANRKGLIDPTRLDRQLFEEIRRYLRNNISKDYESFFIAPPIPSVTQEQMDTITDEWEDLKQKQENTVSITERDYIVSEARGIVENRKSNTKVEVEDLEQRIFESLEDKDTGSYIFAISEVLQYLDVNSNKNKTVGPYARTFRERILTGDIPFETLVDIDPLTALPEFSLNKEVDPEKILKFAEYSQYVFANKLMNVWVYTQTQKMKEVKWYNFPARPKFDPTKSSINVEKMCGATENTVFVKENGQIVCKPRSEVLKNIESLEKENSDYIRELL